MRRFVASLVVLGVVSAFGFARPTSASYACIEISDCCSCSGECWYYDDETGKQTGHVRYRC